MDGISVVICCHNSSTRLPATLSHLARQQVALEIRWEILVVDNASTDDTSEVARQSWPGDAPAELRVTSEPQLGLTHARHRGFSEAKYEIVSFIDDDNWVSPDWVQLVSEIMSRHPNVGACGGYIESVYEVPPPWWFENYKMYYAVGAQASEAGDISRTQGYLWGAGLNIRKKAWQELVDRGFSPLLTGRQGKTLSTGEDTELCFALRLAGWGLWYEPRLQTRHFLPAARLEWAYLRKIFRGIGTASVFADLYHHALRGEPKTLAEKLKRTWHWKILATFIKLFVCDVGSLLFFYSTREGNPGILQLENRIGRLTELARRRKAYNGTFRLADPDVSHEFKVNKLVGANDGRMARIRQIAAGNELRRGSEKGRYGC